MRRWHLLWLAVLLAGCAGRPLQVCMNGAMNTSGTIQTVMVADYSAAPVVAHSLSGHADGCCGRVALIDVDGLLLNRNMTGLGSLGENPVGLFREKLDAARRDPRVRAVVLRINSPGGGVTASDMMRRDLEVFGRETGMPVVACLMDLGTGGAYYLASEANVIVAHPTTITGGMGVILNVYNLQDTMAQFNILGVPIKSGEHVDLGSPVRATSPESRRLLQGVSDEFHARFREAVLASRPLRDPPETLFDGRIFTAREALSLRLIDQIGYLSDALDVARQLAGLERQADVVLYRRENDRALTAYDVTPNIPLQNSILPVSLPGLDRSQLPTFLYLWQPEPMLEKTGGL
jgi:protease-4